jgi:lysophospholipase L1-like esterase
MCFLGDSFTLGVGDEGQLGWAGRLVRDHSPEGVAVTYCNLGIRSDTSTGLARRWEAETMPRLRPDRAAGVVLSIGVNDTMPANVAAHPLNRSLANLETIVSGVRRHGWPLLAVGLLPVADPDHTARIRRQDAAFQDWCRDHGVEFCPVFEAMHDSPTWMREVALVDGHHPGPQGYAELTEVLAGQWRAWVASVLKRYCEK